jgi:hypothetical protein
MASYVIRKAWFGWTPAANGVNAIVPPSGVGPPQKSEAAFLASLGPWLVPGTRTTQAAGAVTAGNVVSSTPAAGASAPAGTAVAYIVAV